MIPVDAHPCVETREQVVHGEISGDAAMLGQDHNPAAAIDKPPERRYLRSGEEAR